MKSSSFTHLLWGLVVVVAFVGGYSITEHGPVVRPGGTPPGTISAPDPAAENSIVDAASRKTVDASSPKVLDREQARVRTYELLAEPNRFKRMHALCELLAGLSKDNWREVLDAFVRQATKTGRRHDEEWSLLMEHIGEVAGADALGADVVRGPDVGVVFSGFAARDSRGAIEWFNVQKPELQQSVLGRLLRGVAQTDPKQAFTLALTQTEDFWEPAMEEIVASTIQHGGFAAAEEMYESIKTRADVSGPIKNQVFLEMARRKSFAAGVESKSAEALAWFDRYLGPDAPSDSGVMPAAQVIVARAAKDDGVGTLSWIDTRVDRFSEGQATAAYKTAARSFYEKAPDEFVTWMNSHADHPQRDAMTVAVVNSLLDRRDFDQAKAWVETVRDATQRKQVDQRFKTLGIALTK